MRPVITYDVYVSYSDHRGALILTTIQFKDGRYARTTSEVYDEFDLIYDDWLKSGDPRVATAAPRAECAVGYDLSRAFNWAMVHRHKDLAKAKKAARRQG